MNYQNTELGLGLDGNLTENLFVTTKTPFAENDYPGDATPSERPSERPSESPMRQSQLHDLVKAEFYQKDNWFNEMCEVLFKLKRRNTTVKAEVYYGIIHFISCLYCLAVVVSCYHHISYFIFLTTCLIHSISFLDISLNNYKMQIMKVDQLLSPSHCVRVWVLSSVAYLQIYHLS